MMLSQNEKVFRLSLISVSLCLLVAAACTYKKPLSANVIKYSDSYGLDEFTYQSGYVDSFSTNSNQTIVMDKSQVDNMFYVNAVSQEISLGKDLTTVLAMDFAKIYAADNPNASAETLVKETNSFVAKIDVYKSQAATGESEGVKEFAKLVSLVGDAMYVAGATPADKAAGEALARASTHFTDVQKWVTGDDVKFDSQESLSNEYDKGVVNQRAIVQEWKDVAPHDPRLAKVDKLVIEQRVGVGVKDGATKILDRKPMFRDTYIGSSNLKGTVKVYQELQDINAQMKGSIGADGKLTIKMNDLNKMVKGLIEENGAAVREQIALAKNSDANMQKLLEMEENRSKAEAKAKKEANDERLIQMGYQASHATVNIFSSILEVAKVEPRTVAQFSAVAHGVIAVSEILHKFNTSNTSADAARFGTAIMMGDFVSLAMGLVKVFAQTGPTPEQLILNQLVEIQKAIGDLRKEMHDRFDRLDRSIGEMHREMHISFSRLIQMVASISADINDVNIQVSKIGVDLSNIKSRIVRIEELTIESAKLHANIQVRKIYNQCYEPSIQVKNALGSDKLKECLEMIESLATDFALNGAIAEKGAASSDESEIIERLSNPNLDSQINLLKDIAHKPEYFVDELKNISSKGLSNIQYWTLSAQFVNQIIIRNPKSLKALPSGKISNVIGSIYKSGNDLRYFNQIIRGEKFVKKLNEAYVNEVNSFIDQGAGSLADVWNQAVSGAISQYIQSEQTMLAFKFYAFETPHETGREMTPYENDQRQFPKLIRKLLSVKWQSYDANIGIGWFGKRDQTQKEDGPTYYCYGMPHFNLMVYGMLDGTNYNIISSTKPYQIPDHNEFRWHLRAPNPCPTIQAIDIASYLAPGSFRDYYTGSISALIPKMAKEGAIVSYQTQEIGLHVSKLIYQKAMLNFQTIIKETILGVSSTSNNIDLKKRLARLEYRKKVLDTFLSYAFPRALKNRDILYHSLFGGMLYSGLMETQVLYSLVAKDPMVFNFYMRGRSLITSCDGCIEDMLDAPLLEKQKVSPDSLTEEERKRFEQLISVKIPQRKIDDWKYLDRTKATLGVSAFTDDSIELVGGLRKALYYNGSASMTSEVTDEPVTLIKFWADYRTKTFSSHLYEQTTKMEAEEINNYSLQLDSLRITQKFSELMRSKK